MAKIIHSVAQYDFALLASMLPRYLQRTLQRCHRMHLVAIVKVGTIGRHMYHNGEGRLFKKADGYAKPHFHNLFHGMYSDFNTIKPETKTHNTTKVTIKMQKIPSLERFFGDRKVITTEVSQAQLLWS